MKHFTPKESAFIREYLASPTLNATDAARRAGYSERTAPQAASRLLRKVKIKETIDEAMKKRIERVEIKQDDVLREILRVMKSDVGDFFDDKGRMLPLSKIPLDSRRAVSSIEVDEDGQVKLKLWNKMEATKLAGLHLKLFTEKHQHEHSLFEMTDEQLEVKKRELIAKEGSTK